MIYDSKTGLVEFEYWQNREMSKMVMPVDMIECVREAFSSGEKSSGYLSAIYCPFRDGPIFLNDSYEDIKKLMETVHKKGA